MPHPYQRNNAAKYICSNDACRKLSKSIASCRKHIAQSRVCKNTGAVPIQLSEYVTRLPPVARVPCHPHPTNSPIPQSTGHNPAPTPDTHHQMPAFYNTDLCPPLDTYSQNINNEAGWDGELNDYGKYMGFETESINVANNLCPDHEGWPTATGPGLIDELDSEFNPWIDPAHPWTGVGATDDDGNTPPEGGGIPEDQWATPNGAMPGEIPVEAAHGWGMEEDSIEMGNEPPLDDGFACQWQDWGQQRESDAGNRHDGVPYEAPPPEILYNPFNDGAEPAYIRIDTPDKIIFKYASAGGIVQKAGQDKTQWQKLREVHEAQYGTNAYGRWKTKREWDDAYYFATAKTPQSGLQELLKTERYASDPPEFKTVKKLFKTVETDMNEFGPPKLETQEIRLAEAPLDRHVLAYMDVEKGADYLFANPRFDGMMDFTPVVEFGPDGIRRYGNIKAGNYWNLRQRALQPGTTLGGIVMMSNATQLSQFSGDASAHGVYISLVNIDKSV
ncbi:hypothetical protein FS749_002854 [Ceratobasidium sp. UAMH 11750]|nr:hypothetical protein FS749_002854 [Ceratobasidium sp. UAMH 11750]